MISIRDTELIINFGKRLKQLRTEQNLSQQLLANKAEIELSQIFRIEKGKTNVTLSTIGAIANALDISIASLFDFSSI